jgi:hypothetical protein
VALVNLRGEVIGMNSASRRAPAARKALGCDSDLDGAGHRDRAAGEGKVTRSQLGVTIRISTDLAKGLGIRDTDGVLISDVMQTALPNVRVCRKAMSSCRSMNAAGNVPRSATASPAICRARPWLEVMRYNSKGSARRFRGEARAERVAANSSSPSDEAPEGLGLSFRMTPVGASTT